MKVKAVLLILAVAGLVGGAVVWPLLREDWRARNLETSRARIAAFKAVLDRESKRLQEGTTTLAAAVAVLEKTDLARDRECMGGLSRQYPSLTSGPELLAAMLAQNALSWLPEGAARDALHGQLQRAFREFCGKGLPSPEERTKQLVPLGPQAPRGGPVFHVIVD